MAPSPIFMQKKNVCKLFGANGPAEDDRPKTLDDIPDRYGAVFAHSNKKTIDDVHVG